jgi:hypothetical protein
MGPLAFATGWLDIAAVGVAMAIMRAYPCAR